MFLIGELTRTTAEAVAGGDIPVALEPAWKAFLAKAEETLNTDTFSVIHKKHMPPDTIDTESMNLRFLNYQHKPLPKPSKHDFVSLGTYYWPNPDTEDGLPYVSMPKVNPEREEYDHKPLANMCSTVAILTQAYAMTSDEKYADAAARHVRAWFLDPQTCMTPHMTYAQHIPGEGGFRALYNPRCVGLKDGKKYFVAYGGLIEAHRLPTVVECIRTIRTSTCWTNQDEAGLKEWFFDFMRWMMESQMGHDESAALNNHGSWYTAQVASYAEYAEDPNTLDNVLDTGFPVRVLLQIEPDGRQPHELTRHISWSYVTMATESFYCTALVADRHGRDLWHYRTSDGRGLKAAIDWIVERVRGEKKIEGQNLEGVNYTPLVPLLAIAAIKYKDTAYADLIEKLPDYPEDHRFRLLFPAEKARKLAAA